MTKRNWVVLPDQLSIRVFFDTGIVSGLRERLDGGLAAVFLVPGEAAAEWVERHPGLPVYGEELTASGALEDVTDNRTQLDRELSQISASSQVEDELAKLKAEVGPGDDKKEIEPGTPAT